MLSHIDGTLRVQLDELAYAPLLQASLNHGDEEAWRQALPPEFKTRSSIESGGVCESGDRVIRHEDADVRNWVELRACVEGESPAFLSGFSFRDNAIALERGIAPGTARTTILQALGISVPGDDIQSIEVVNEEQNTTLRLGFDASGRLQQIDYDPYTG